MRRMRLLVGLSSLLCSLVLAGCGDDDGGVDTDTDAGGGSGELVQVVFQSKWFPQSQFAGYYVAGGHPMDQAASDKVPLGAAMKNFYAEEGLDVIILPGGMANPSQEVAEGRADFGTDWITNMVAQIEQNDYDLVHLAQVFQRPGFELVALSSSGITTIEDFRDKKVGVWDFGNEFPAQVCISQAGLSSSLDEDLPPGQPADVETVTYAFDPKGVFPEMVDVASAMVYNELNQIVGLGHPLDQLSRLAAADNDCGLLEDFIFTKKSVLDDPNFKDSGMSGREIAVRFLRASLKGWAWITDPANQAVATNIVLDFCGDTCAGSEGQTPMDHQTWQMARVAELVQPGLLDGGEMRTVGCLDITDYNDTLTRLQGVGFIREGTGTDILESGVLTEAGTTCP